MVNKKKVLVVDDDPTVVKVLEKYLSGKGFDVVCAADGIEAMVQVKNHQPHLIVLDIMMPEVNGYDVCRNIKFDSPYKEIPILLLTSRDQEIDPRIGQMMGIDYMQKPINREAFLDRIEMLLG